MGRLSPVKRGADLASEPNTVMCAGIGVCTVGLVVCGRTGGMNDDDDAR